ncbi:MAG TPA: APC family permease, partial [Vicinamibacterales bacterium]
MADVQMRGAAAPSLRRELGRWDLTAIGVNQVIGGGVFALPAAVAAASGRWSVALIAAVGLVILMIASSFAEVGSRFDATGGPYLYTRAAFGRFAAFEVGWMLWFSRVASWASVINVLVASLGFYWPAFTAGPLRSLVLTGLIASLAVINVLGIRQSALFVNAVTIGKLLPLVTFVLVGAPAMQLLEVVPNHELDLSRLSSTALLLVFAFGGFEVIPVVAGEARDPRRHVPFALIATVLIYMPLLALVQIITMSSLPDLAASRTPLADAAARLMGAGGAAMITIGALLSTTGNNMGQALSGSRNLFALAEQGDLPPLFGRVHPRFRTPVNAILITSSISLVLALSGTFVTMAAASAISRLIVYFATCASALRFRAGAEALGVAPALFRVPFGPLIPLIAMIAALVIILAATPAQLIGGAFALAIGAALFLVA